MKNAPATANFFVVASQKTGDNSSEIIITMGGSPSGVILDFQQGFERSPDIKDIVTDALNFHNYRNGSCSARPSAFLLRSMINEMGK